MANLKYNIVKEMQKQGAVCSHSVVHSVVVHVESAHSTQSDWLPTGPLFSVLGFVVRRCVCECVLKKKKQLGARLTRQDRQELVVVTVVAGLQELRVCGEPKNSV